MAAANFSRDVLENFYGKIPENHRLFTDEALATIYVMAAANFSDEDDDWFVKTSVRNTFG